MSIVIEVNDEKPVIEELCRLCANTDNQFIPIFQGEGVEHNIAEQIEKYLPIITVTKGDELPLQICFQCTSSLLAWHNFFEQCRVADSRLREMSANVKFKEDDGSFIDYADCFEDQTVVSERTSDITQEEIVLPGIIIDDVQLMETCDNVTVNVNQDVSESVSENLSENRFARHTTSKRADDVRLAPKETAPRESGAQCEGMGDAVSLCECSQAKAECSACARHEGRSVRCRRCPMVFLSAERLARHVSSSHNERSPSSARESADTTPAEPNARPKRRMAVKGKRSASAPKAKARKVDATEEPSGDVDVAVNGCATSTRVSAFQCPECPKAYQLASSLKRHSVVHQRLTPRNVESANSGQNGRLAADSKTEKLDVDPSANKTSKRIGERESNSDEPSAPTEATSPDAETTSEQPTERQTCRRSSRRSTSRRYEDPPPPSLPVDTIVCAACDEKFDDEATFAEHQRLRHGGAQPAACDVCELQLPTATQLRAHKIANHRAGRRRGRAAADDQPDPFARWYVWVDAEKRLKCDQCAYNSQWSQKGRFLEHYRIHTGERPHPCEVCAKRFRTRTLLQKHVQYVHEGVKEHACDLCGRRFSDKRYVRDHRRIHTGERPYVCDLCGKTFKQSASLFIHQELHKGLRKHACDMCGKRFTTRSSLTVHIKRHVGERNFVCAVCGKAFVDGKHLRDHSTVHSDERPFGCELCGARFKLRKHLKQHGRTHKREFAG